MSKQRLRLSDLFNFFCFSSACLSSFYIDLPTLKTNHNYRRRLSYSSLLRSLDVSASMSPVRSSCVCSWWGWWVWGLGGGFSLLCSSHTDSITEPLGDSSRQGACWPVEDPSTQQEERSKESLYLVVMLWRSLRLCFSPTNPQTNKQTDKQVLPSASTSCDWVTLSRKLAHVTQGRSEEVQGLIYPRIKNNIPTNCPSSAACLLRMWEGAS